jgi:hypothetical protein
MTPEEKIEFLGGQVHALVGVCAAFINNDPNPTRLDKLLETVEQATLARVESELVQEDYLEGVRDVMDRLRKAAASAAARQTRPPPSNP